LKVTLGGLTVIDPLGGGGGGGGGGEGGGADGGGGGGGDDWDADTMSVTVTTFSGNPFALTVRSAWCVPTPSWLMPDEGLRLVEVPERHVPKAQAGVAS
jgi:hypothetical protein